ncbi:alcohol dehydrogenase 1-like, partial [Neosynchiropus ocellatus]
LKLKAIRCKAAVAWEPGTPLVIEEVEVAAPGPGEVRIKIVATALCHSDLIFLCDDPSNFPVILGHEASGIIESVGPGVTEFEPGDKVVPLSMPQCRECHLCVSPKGNSCVKAWNRQSAQNSRITCGGKTIQQFRGMGTFSEYTVMYDYSVGKINPAAPLKKVCPIGCGISTGFGAAVNTAKVEPGSTCAVFGLGTVGLAAVMGCHVAGAKRIIAVDINPEKFKTAKLLGATDFLNPNDYDTPINRVIADMTNEGVDYSLECAGNVDVMDVAFKSTSRAWGVCVIVGWIDKWMNPLKPIDLICGRTLKGSVLGGYKGKDGIALMVDGYMEGKFKVDEFITHNMNLEEINEAIELLKQGKSIRTVMTF